MEAATLPKKKAKLSKGKMKKSMKNILCRPDPLYWPEVSTEDAQDIKKALNKHKVETQEFLKPHWADIKNIPKSERPRPPKKQKVDGILFGITTCSHAIAKNTCQVIILEAEVNPRIMVQHIVDLCTTFRVPLICLKGLKSISKDTFGFPTSCMAIKRDVKNIAGTGELLSRIAEKYKVVLKLSETKDMELEDILANHEKAKTDKNTEIDKIPFTYLYRNSKESRIFKPPTENVSSDQIKAFSGQDFIKVPISKQQQSKKLFKNMVVTKVSNNQNRKRKT